MFILYLPISVELNRLKQYNPNSATVTITIVTITPPTAPPITTLDDSPPLLVVPY